MQCPQCNATIDEDTFFCGNCGRQIAPQQATGTTVSYPVQSDGGFIGDPGGARGAPFVPQGVQNPVAQARRYSPAPDIPRQVDTPPQSSLPQSHPGNFRRITLIAALILVIIAGGTLGLIVLLRNNNTVVASHATGQVTFNDSQSGAGHTDALKILISGLDSPPSGSQYDAWLVNDQNEQTIALGKLVTKGRKFALSYAGDGKGGKSGTNLLGAGNKLEITLEQGNVALPTGKVILVGTFPPLAFIHIRHLLFLFPTTPGQIGLLVGALQQTQLLNAQALLLQSFVANGDQRAIPCLAQSLIDIIEGAQGVHNQPLPAICASQNITAVGDGFGLLGTNAYLSTASHHASLAATQTDSTDNIRFFAGHVVDAMNNIKGWVTTIEQDALNLLNHPGSTAKIQEIVTLSDQAFHGVDIDGDGSVDPVPGEAGAITGYDQGQLMANLPLVPVA